MSKNRDRSHRLSLSASKRLDFEVLAEESTARYTRVISLYSFTHESVPIESNVAHRTSIYFELIDSCPEYLPALNNIGALL